MKISEERKNDAIISWRKITSYRKNANVRDLGGYETQEGYYTKSHKYVRSTCPSGISDDLKEQFYQYGIRTVIDLRSDYELVHQPHSLKGYKDIEYYHINLLQNENMSVFQMILKTIKI